MAMKDDEKTDLVTRASAWCVSNGILMGARDPITRQPLGGFVFEPAPYSLYPTPFSRKAFEKAYDAALPFNQIVHTAAKSDWLLDEAIVTAVKGDPDFTGKLVAIGNEVRRKGRAQNVVLGILRSDYMLHGSDTPLQVELNTIASSFGCLSSKVTTMHKALHGNKDGADSTLPDNRAADGIANGLATALREYERQFPISNAVIVMVVQPGETNSTDQRDLEFLLQTKHGVTLERKTLKELSSCHSNEKGELVLGDGKVAGVVYYRAGYTPNDYPSEKEWEGRSIVEYSTAIKSPDIFYHIFGAKKVQQALAAPGVLRRFARSDEEDALLRSTFAGLYALGEGDDGPVVEMALANPQDFVLKPQREGGGNNLYNEELVEALQRMSYSERGAYILMQKIVPPVSPGSLVRGDAIVYEGETVCELGVFGVTLREYDGDRVILDEKVGHILRAKASKTDEGGVAAGYAFLSSPKLV